MLLTIAALVLLFASADAGMSGVVLAAETPRRGGILLAVIGADPPSLDPHQGGHLRQYPARGAVLQPAPAVRSVQLPESHR